MGKKNLEKCTNNLYRIASFMFVIILTISTKFRIPEIVVQYSVAFCSRLLGAILMKFLIKSFIQILAVN